MPKKNSAGQILGSLLVAGIVVWWLAGHDPESKPADPATASSLPSNAPLSAADVVKRVGTIHNVLSVKQPSDENGQVYAVSIQQDSIFEGGNTSKDVLHTIRNHASQTSYKAVSIDMIENLVDGYGRASQVPILRLRLRRDDVEKFNYDNVIGWNILNIAKVTSLDPVSTTIVGQECAPDSGNAKYAAAFCANAAAADHDNQADASQ